MARTPTTDFWSTVVFELRQPMTAVRGQAQRAQLLIETDPARATEAMEQVVQQIVRIDRMLEELRDRLARQEERHAKDHSDARDHRPTPLRR